MFECWRWHDRDGFIHVIGELAKLSDPELSCHEQDGAKGPCLGCPRKSHEAKQAERRDRATRKAWFIDSRMTSEERSVAIAVLRASRQLGGISVRHLAQEANVSKTAAVDALLLLEDLEIVQHGHKRKR